MTIRCSCGAVARIWHPHGRNSKGQKSYEVPHSDRCSNAIKNRKKR